MNNPLLFFNGIDLARTREKRSCYWRAPMRLGDFVDRLIPDQDRATQGRAAQGRAAQERAAQGRAVQGWDSLDQRDVIEGVRAEDLDSAGWGMIVHEREDPEILEALAPLRKLRGETAGDRYFRPLPFRDGDDVSSFLMRHGAGRGDANPRRLPYYLLIIGDPTRIPFSFQCELDVSYAVGRLAFAEAAGYERYAAGLAAWERSPGQAAQRRLLFFGVDNGDRLTGLSGRYLIDPLAKALGEGIKGHGWKLKVQAADATKKRDLAALLEGPHPPSLLFSAGHGVTCSDDAESRERLQGGLVCGDWRATEEIQRDHCYCGEDLPTTADLRGCIHFQFGCFSAGTPEFDTCRYPTRPGRRLHEAPFVADHARAMLKQGALAVIGHVDQAFQHAFLWDERVNEIDHFGSVLAKLMRGLPVGYAMEHLNRRYAHLAAVLMGRLFEPDPPHPEELKLRAWLAMQDARNYVVLGDPAARLKPPPATPDGT